MFSYLALGDSYTIGEGVPLSDSYPYQTVQLLRRAGHEFLAPEIIARTGWTTGELIAATEGTRLLSRYDLVTLLIGANDQYRGHPAEEYGVGLETLLVRALGLGKRVIVLSIPDWGVSPFAEAGARDPKRISREIDIFNAIANNIARHHHLPFIDITPHSRAAGSFVSDGLHPAADVYAFWARQLARHIGDEPAQ